MAKSRYFQSNSMEDIKTQAQNFRSTNQAAAVKSQTLTQQQLDNAVQQTLTEKATGGIYNNPARRDSRIRNSVDTSSYDQQIAEKRTQLERTPASYDLNDSTRYNLKQEILELEKQKEAFTKSEYERLKTEDWEKRQAAAIKNTGNAELFADLKQLNDLEALVKANQNMTLMTGGTPRITQTEKDYWALQKRLSEQYGGDLGAWKDYAARVANQERAEKTEQELSESAKENPFWWSLGTLPLNMASGLGFADVAGQRLKQAVTGSDTPIDYNTPAMMPSQATNTIRGSVSEKIGQDTAGKVGSNTALGNLYSGAYNLGMSMGDSAIGMLTGGNTALLAGGAATNAMNEAVSRGATTDQALTMGMTAGVMEGVMEKLSIDSLFNMTDAKTAKQLALNVLKQGGVEATEEVATNIANTVADALIMGDKSHLNTAKNAYIQQGYSPEEAEKLAMKEWGAGLATDAIVGFLSGGIFEGVKGSAGYFNNRQGYTPKNVPIDNTWTTEQKADLDRWLNDWMQEGREPTMTQSQVDNAIQETLRQNNTAPAAQTETESTSINTNPAKHTGVEQRIIDEFQNSVDEGLVAFARDTLNGNGSNVAKNQRYPLRPVSDRAAADILRETNVNTAGFSTAIERRAIEHIDLGHGENGSTDHSMRDLNDLGRIQYVLDNYDSVSAGGKSSAYTTIKPNGKPGQAKTVVFEKAVNGTYYVVEAVPDTKAKTTFIVSAYMSQNGAKKAEAEQTADTVNSPNVDVRNENARASVNFSIPESGENVNGSVGAAESGFNPYSQAANTYGAIEPGENPARIVDVPKSMDGQTKVMQTVRTILEADVTTDTAVPELENEIVAGGFSKMPITDQAASDRATATIQRVGYDRALADWRAQVRDGKVSKDSVAVGEMLYNAAVSAGDTKSAVKIAVDLATQVRSAAQALQAVRMLKKMSPAAQLYGVKQNVDNLQKKLEGQYGDRVPDLVIDETLAANFLEANTDAERTAAEEALYEDIARQIPATFSDKWNAWRYLSMLGNPRTHIRNIVGNAAFAPVRGVKNQLGGLMETIAQGVGIMDKSQRTKSVGFNWSKKRRALKQAAKADYSNAQGQIQSGDKYNSATDIIEKNRRIFNNAALETLRRGNSAALDVEDQWFSKGAYANSLSGYLNARGYTAEDFIGNGMTDQQKDDARAYAILEAQKATYRDLNALSELVTSIKFKNPANSQTRGGAFAKRAANTVVEGVLPFKKTPANILARAVEYSPAGLVKALTVDTVQVARGKTTAAEYMDHLSSGLTGTGLFALGYFLSQSGLLVGGAPEDEDQFNLEGRQPYSLEVGGTSVTLDWLAPEALPVFMGVELAEAIEEYGGEALSMETMKSVFQGITGPILEMSMMSGLQDALDAVSFADDKMSAIVANAALGYLGQAVPTLFGQIERIVGSNAETRQTTFTQKGQFLDTDTQYALGSTLNKVPFLDFQQIPYIDAWGRTESTGNTAERSFNNLINPAYTSKIEETPVDAEIKRLEQATGENLTPSRAEKVLTVNGEKVLLTSQEYVTYATAKGQNDYTFRESLIGSEDYAVLDDATKAKAMEYAKDYADALAREETGLNADMAEWMAELDGADIGTVTQRFIEKSVESMAGNKKLYDNKYDGISGLLDSGTINDKVALAIMSDSAVDGYMDYCQKAGVSVAEYADVYAYMNKTDDKEKTLQYIEGLNTTKAKKVAMAQAIYGANPTFIPLDSDVPKNWLLEMGATDEIVEQFSENQTELYNTYIRDTGVDMGEYLEIWAFKNSAKSDKDANGKTTYSAQNKVIDQIDRLDRSKEYKRNMFLGMGYSAKNIPYWWK